MANSDHQEIELRFLVKGDGWPRSPTPYRIEQGYLSTHPERAVRARLRGDEGFLTIKGKASGGVRLEFEYPIPREHAEKMIALCGSQCVRKVRHVVEIDGIQWEIDEFGGENSGLVLAEAEVDHVAKLDEVRRRLPPWIGVEVTDDHRYSNAALSERPFASW